MVEKIRIFSTFTGIGSPEMALKNIGVDFEVVGISEVDRYALMAYDAIHNEIKPRVRPISKEAMLTEFDKAHIGYNFSTNKSEIPKNEKDIRKLYYCHIANKNFGDIRLIDEKKMPDFDLFTYSFPCKNISVAGTGAGFVKGSETQSSLLWECDRIIKEKLPTYLMMENVKNLVGKANIDVFKEWIRVLDDHGYNSYWSVLNGKNYGVPQNRERVMMISILKEHDEGTFKMPTNDTCDTCLKDILEEDVEEHYFLKPESYVHLTEDLPHQNIAYCIDARYAKGASVDIFINKKRRQLIQVGNMDKILHANTRIYHEEGICPTLNSMQGGNRQPKVMMAGRIVGRNPDNPKSRERGLPTVQMLEINKNTNVTNTLTTVQKDNVVASRAGIDFKVRRLTPLECWRLMGYHDEDFLKAKDKGRLSNSKLYERAGRGIIVPMLESIFTNLFNT